MPTIRRVIRSEGHGIPRGSLTRRGKPRLLSLSDLDQRTSAAKVAKALIAEVSADLGGEDRLTAAQRQLIMRSAMLGAIAADLEARWVAGETIEVGELMQAANAQRRLLVSLGLDRRARDMTPSLSEYLRRKREVEADTLESEE
jgi:hypothetical protein